MAKLKKLKLWKSAADPHFEIQIEVGRAGVFFAKLPEEMALHAQAREMQDATLTGLEDKLRAAFLAYIAAAREERLVIVIRCDTADSFRGGLYLNITAETFTRVSFPSGGVKYEPPPAELRLPVALAFRDPLSARHMTGHTVMDYTPERAAYFTRLAEGFQRMSAELESILNSEDRLDLAAGAPLSLQG